MDEYDRWYRAYRRRQQIASVAVYLVAGALIATIMWAVLFLMAVVFG